MKVFRAACLPAICVFLAAGGRAHAGYTFTTLTPPANYIGFGANGISGSTVVGGYADGSIQHGFMETEIGRAHV